ncbi:MAG: alanine--tRNA ligase, partial [Propionibacteriaceae bacterium]
YIDFFVRHDHAAVPSASLVHNDPNLLFVVAGMVPMVPYFTQQEPAPWKRAVSVQKCIRTLDIDEVGKTTRHGTFFQMLGNFSFGDYFKAEVIPWTWEFLTGSIDEGNLGIDPDRFYVSVLGAGFHPAYPEGDVEAREIWRSIGLPDERIIGRDLKENYWHMGVPGPGGPDSEIFYDRGPEFGPDGGPDVSEDRYIEIWNNVFQQEMLSAVRRKDDFDVECPLPSKNIDTGAGLERIAFLLQGKNNLYEIDEVFPVIAKAAELSGKRYGDNTDDDVRLRVIADHLRSSLMLLSDGVRPGNEARGYVLRRLLRRSIRSMRLLGYQAPCVVELLDTSRQVMRESYPEIDAEWPRVRELAEKEEESFRRTLVSGTQIFDLAVADAQKAGATVLTGDAAFKLHDTYGFPIDLTLEMASEQGLAVDQDAFRSLMQEQKQRAKADARAKKGGAANLDVYKKLRELGETAFTGYDELSGEDKIRGIIKDGELVDRAAPGDIVEIVLPATPFYAEAGGQDADTGWLRAEGIDMDVVDVQKPLPGLIVHKVRIGDGEVALGMPVSAQVDPQNRFAATQAHSATHLIHAALRQVVGSTATQAGSYNKPGYLRFDYSAAAGLSPEQRLHIESLANEAIRRDEPLTARQLPLAEAKSLGAMAMFGEKYPEIVRMVDVGDGQWSRELCGGTHVQHTGQISMLNLLGESSIGSGVRRVEALVSTDAFAKFAAERALVTTLTDLLKVQPEQLTERVGSLIEQLKTAEKTIAAAKAKQALALAPQLAQDPATIGSVAFVGAVVPDLAGGDLRALAIDVRERLGEHSGVVCLVSVTDGKPGVVVATTAAARAAGLAAGQLVGIATAVLGGKGGGKPDFAQGGGTAGDQAQAAVSA